MSDALGIVFVIVLPDEYPQTAAAFSAAVGTELAAILITLSSHGVITQPEQLKTINTFPAVGKKWLNLYQPGKLVESISLIVSDIAEAVSPLTDIVAVILDALPVTGKPSISVT